MTKHFFFEFHRFNLHNSSFLPRYVGIDKRKLIVVGKSLNPRCFKKCKSLPVEYYANSRAWMTGELFIKILTKFDREMVAKKRKILMFIDNCSAHGKVEAMQSNFKAITLTYFPPNTTSHLQPLDQGIINSLKAHYRARMLRKVIAGVEADGTVTPPNLLDAIQIISASWHLDVSETIITKCFRKAGITKETVSADVPDDDVDGWDSLSDAVSSFINLVGVPSGFDQSEFETIDENVVCVEPLLGTDESIIDSINGTADTESEAEDESQET